MSDQASSSVSSNETRAAFGRKLAIERANFMTRPAASPPLFCRNSFGNKKMGMPLRHPQVLEKRSVIDTTRTPQQTLLTEPSRRAARGRDRPARSRRRPGGRSPRR
jgi:hypothetical protein